jgi:hypothetical protein
MGDPVKLYHYMDEEFGLQNIANRKIKASTFMKLNDLLSFFV